jgi:uncharacterized membrane protein YdbT with pleckstrin-like domain
MLVIAALILLRPIIAKLTTGLVITNPWIIAKFGVSSRKTLELQLSNIESIRFDQGVLGRICNHGTLVVVGTGGSKEPIPSNSRPLDFRKQSDQVLDNHDNKKATA